MKPIEFFVRGIPASGGSKTGFFASRLKRVILRDSNPRAAPWKDTVRTFAIEAYKGDPILGPLIVECTFYVMRPKGHYGTGKNADVLKPSAPPFPVTKPDATKLWRPTEDALTGIIWKDDAQVISQLIKKRYGNKPGAKISIKRAVQTLDKARKARDKRRISHKDSK